MHTFAPVVGLLALLSAGAGPDEAADATEAPLVGRPNDLPFSEGVGSFQVTARAEPTRVQAEKPLRLTLRVEATGPVRHPPQRIDLRQVPAVTEAFYVEDAPDADRHPDERTWEFVYVLKPRGTEVTEVPGLPFAFYNPAIRPASRGFQVVYTDPIPLHVSKHAVYAVPLEVPASAYQLATGPELLAQRTPWRLPGPAWLALLLAAPPLLCAAWYTAWRRLNPDVARRAMQRRSRAARLALEALRGARRLPAEQQAVRAAATVAGYLRERLDLTVAEPTPAEVAGYLKGRGLSAGLTEQAAHFFELCDAARFLPAPEVAGTDLAEAASQVVLAVEAETCPPPRS
jgi:hypothetical protein